MELGQNVLRAKDMSAERHAGANNFLEAERAPNESGTATEG